MSKQPWSCKTRRKCELKVNLESGLKFPESIVPLTEKVPLLVFGKIPRVKQKNEYDTNHVVASCFKMHYLNLGIKIKCFDAVTGIKKLDGKKLGTKKKWHLPRSLGFHENVQCFIIIVSLLCVILFLKQWVTQCGKRLKGCMIDSCFCTKQALHELPKYSEGLMLLKTSV